MTHRLRQVAVCAIPCLMIVGVWTLRPHAATPATYRFNIISITSPAGSAVVAPGEFPVITFSVTDTQTGAPYDLKTDPVWTQTASGASRLFFQVGWNTVEITNRDSGSNTVGGRGAAMPIPVNALASTVIANGDGTYQATSPLPIPLTATGTGEVAMEGHPAGPDATGALTVRVPVRSAFKYFRITGSTLVPRRQIVDVNKCMRCHRSDGTGRAPRLVVHGSNRTEEVQVCVVCHNPNNTDIVFRQATDAKVVIGSNTYPEQSLDFKRLVHGIHASSKGFRENPLVVIGFNHTIFDASTLIEYPGELKNCVTCHIDNGTQGTFELPLAPGVLGPSFDTGSFQPDGTVVINTDPTNDVKISPTAAVCSSCHDKREVLSHMVRTGGASFSTDLLSLQNGVVRERCVTCHGPGREKSVRKVHLGDDD